VIFRHIELAIIIIIKLKKIFYFPPLCEAERGEGGEFMLNYKKAPEFSRGSII